MLFAIDRSKDFFMNQLKVLTISALSVGLFFVAPFAMAQVDEVVHPNVIVAEGVPDYYIFIFKLAVFAHPLG